MMMHMNQQPPTITEASLGRQVDPSFEQLVMKLLQKEPAERYQSMDDVAAALWGGEKPCCKDPDPLSNQNEVLESGINSSSVSRHWWRGNASSAVSTLVLIVICSLVAVYLFQQTKALPKQDGAGFDSQSSESKEPAMQQSSSTFNASARNAVKEHVKGETAIDLSNLALFYKIKKIQSRVFRR